MRPWVCTKSQCISRLRERLTAGAAGEAAGGSGGGDEG